MTQRILIVEDDPISAQRATKLLSELDAEIIVVGTGADAIAQFENKAEIDLVLMDLYLPDLSGIKTSEQIKTTEHYCDRRIPIVALTSNTLMEPKEQFLKSTGFADYITKPVRTETFSNLVKKHLPKPVNSLGWY